MDAFCIKARTKGQKNPPDLRQSARALAKTSDRSCSIEKLRPQTAIRVHVDIFDIKLSDALLVQFLNRHTDLNQFRNHGKYLLCINSLMLYRFHFLLSLSCLLCLVIDIMRKPGAHLSDSHHTNRSKSPPIGASGLAA